MGHVKAHKRGGVYVPAYTRKGRSKNHKQTKRFFTNDTPKLFRPNSSMIDEVAHDGDTLTVKFKNNSTYSYSGVKPATYKAFMKGSGTSAGKWFNKNIKNKYPTKKL